MFNSQQASRIIELTSNSKTYPEQLSVLASLLASFQPSRYLEIGAFEGRSLGLFAMLSSSLHNSPLHITSVDSWQGGDEHKASGFDMSGAEFRYDCVASICSKVLGKRIKLEKIKSLSRRALSAMADREGLYDLILIDAGHKSKDVLEDLILSWPLLRKGGLMILDDYTWVPKHSGQINILLESPKMGIDSFLNCYSDEVVILSMLPLLQLYVLKEDPGQVAGHHGVIHSTGIPAPLDSLIQTL